MLVASDTMNLGNTSLLDKLDRLPPILCRLLAKENGKLMSDVRLSKLTGWGLSKLRRVYRQTTWGNVTVEDADVFLTACGCSWSSQRRQLWHLSRPRSQFLAMRHLKAASVQEAAMISRHQRRMVALLQAKLEKAT